MGLMLMFVASIGIYLNLTDTAFYSYPFHVEDPDGYILFNNHFVFDLYVDSEDKMALLVNVKPLDWTKVFWRL